MTETHDRFPCGHLKEFYVYLHPEHKDLPVYTNENGEKIVCAICAAEDK